MRIGLVIPALNAGAWLDALLPAIASQTVKPDRFLVIDSSSTDGSDQTFRAAGAEVHTIARADFDHGGTRQVALDLLGDPEFVIYLTQDALPASPDTFARLMASFDDEKVGMAYGRQLPRNGATAIEAHARLFNYPAEGWTDSAATLAQRGVRATFCSNSFAAYRVSALREVGGFPAGCIFGEDAIVATRLLLAGWLKRYAADAEVYHSHGYNLRQDFQRNFDVGVMHSEYSALWNQGGIPAGEGLRFVKSEQSYLIRREPVSAISATIRTGLKLLGYSLGRRHTSLPPSWQKPLSMNKGYWRRLEVRQSSGA